MTSNQRWLEPAADSRNFAIALATGLALELAAVVVLLPLVTHLAPPTQTQAPVRLTIEAPPTPKPAPPLPKPLPTPPLPKPPPLPVTQPLPPPPLPQPTPPPRPVARPMLRPAVHVVHHVPPPPVPRPLPKIQPAATRVSQSPPPPAAAPQPAAPSAGQIDLFRDSVRRAVQEAANTVYPQGAQESGEVEITISYLNGHAINVTLARSSGYPLLDAAALKAGQIAPYPEPPSAFVNHVFPWTVTVIFQAAAPSVDSD